MGFVPRLNSLLSRSIMLVVLNDIHSSSGKLKKVRQESIEVSRHFTAEGISFSRLSANWPKNSRAFFFDEA